MYLLGHSFNLSSQYNKKNSMSYLRRENYWINNAKFCVNTLSNKGHLPHMNQIDRQLHTSWHVKWFSAVEKTYREVCLSRENLRPSSILCKFHSCRFGPFAVDNSNNHQWLAHHQFSLLLDVWEFQCCMMPRHNKEFLEN